MENLRMYRKKAAMTQDELAQKVGISRYSIIEYEKCGASPTIKTVERMAEVLGCTLLDLLDKKPVSHEGTNGTCAQNLAKGMSLVDGIEAAHAILACPHKTAELIGDIVEDGEIDHPEYRAVLGNLHTASAVIL